MDQRRFENRVVVITGAGSGIGRATALAFAREGARVQVVDRDAGRAADTVAAIGAAGGVGTAHTVDCTDAAAVLALADRIFASEGRVDVLHNNAGIGHGRAFAETPLEDWRAVLDVNLNGVIHGLHAFVPRMIAAGRGHVVNTASAAGLIGIPKMAPYCAAKFAVVGLSESLSVELAPHNIGVTAVCPGIIRTNIIRDGRIEPGGGLDRSAIQSFFENNGTDPEHIAAEVLDAVHYRRPLVVAPWMARALWWFKRLSTRLYRWGAGRLLAYIASRG